MKRIDKEAVRAAAAGHWRYAIERTCGVDTAGWSKAGPCPKCGGNDRFRAYKDFDRAGGVICRKCHDTQNSDGFSTVEWLLDCDFSTALTKVADYLNVEPSASGKPLRKPAKSAPTTPGPADVKLALIVRDTDPALRQQRAAEWCRRKQGVSAAAVAASRHLTGLYRGEPVIALAGYLPGDMAKPTSVTMYRVNGEPFPMKDTAAKNLNLDGSLDAIIVAGDPSLLAAATHVVKCEGPPDAFATADQLPPGYVAITNACGAKAFRPEFATMLAGKHVFVIHDQDTDGQVGAQRWVDSLAPVAASVVNIQLPYDMVAKGGKDLRDFINEGGRLQDLIKAAPQSIAPPATAAVVAEPQKDPFVHQRAMLADLGLDVLGQLERPGQILVYSRSINRIEKLDDVGRLKRPILKGLIGENQAKINDTPDEIPGTYRFGAILDALCVLGGARKIRFDTVRGAGCWPSTDGRDVLLVGNAEAMRYDGRELSRIQGCRDGHELLGVGEFDAWYEPARLRELVEGCDQAWATKTIEEAIKYFAAWEWEREHDPMLITGCVLSTWVQTLWRFRPHMAISGKTNSGKTSLFAALGMIFGQLAHVSDKSTAAGIRQTVQQSARVILLDEFEKSKHRPEILEMIRTGSRGGKIAMGTTHHKAVEYTVRHSIWISAIETGLRRSPDRNRFISFELLKPTAANHGKLPLPDPDYLGDLGQRLLAIAIRHVVEARDIATKLREHRIHGIDDRQIECFAVPAAILAVATGLRDNAHRLLEQLVGESAGEVESMSDEMDLLHAILRCPVRCGMEDISIARLLKIAASDFSVADDDKTEAMELAGVAYKKRLHGEGMPEVFIDHKRILRTLARSERDWIDQDVRQHLLRIAGARRVRHSIDGSYVHGTGIPWNIVLQEMQGE